MLGRWCRFHLRRRILPGLSGSVGPSVRHEEAFRILRVAARLAEPLADAKVGAADVVDTATLRRRRVLWSAEWPGRRTCDKRTHLAVLVKDELRVLPFGEAAGSGGGEVEAVARSFPQAAQRLGREERAVLLADHAQGEQVARIEVPEDL